MQQNLHVHRFGSAGALLLVALVAAPVATAQEMQSRLGASLRLGLEAVTEPDTTINFRDFASRVVWNGGVKINEEADVVAYLEFGFDDDEGISTTRQAWAGVSGSYGSIKGGKQYRAFYDLSSSFTDIAYWGSCFFQVGCARQEAVIKYEKELGDDVRLIASGTMQNGDEDDDLFDELEAGALFGFGDVSMGAVAGFSTSEFVADSGFALGVAAATTFGEVKVGSSLQFAEADYLYSSAFREAADFGDVGFVGDDALLLNVSAALDRWYAVAGLADADNTPIFATLGYEYPIVQDALMYAEVELSDPDLEGVDTNIALRAVFVYNFGSVAMVDTTEGER